MTTKALALPKNTYLEAYRLMFLSRTLDKKMLIMLRQGKSYFHIGCMGHEAAQVAASLSLEKQKDWLFPYYRDQAFCLGFGMSARDCFLSFLAKGQDPNSGARQMPQHFGHAAHNIPTSSSSTGTQYLQAVGCALANKKLHASKKDFPITVVCSGDGTASQGDFHEALSWAAKDKLPVVFFIENNGYAISVPLSEQRSGQVADQGAGYPGVKVMRVDGCDFEKSYKAFKEAASWARAGKGPVLLQVDVVRLLPHSSSDDHKKYRAAADLLEEEKKDPIVWMQKFLVHHQIITAKKLEILEKEIEKEVDLLAEACEQEENPDKHNALLYVSSGESEPPLEDPYITSDCKEYVVVDAINRALAEEMKHNSQMLIFGEDVAGKKGGVFTATRGLTDAFGADRCFNSPLAESSIVGVSIGLALRGFKPVPEIQFGDYIWTAMMQIRNELATVRYRSNNMFSSPVVIRVPVGGYIHGGLCHSQNIEATFSHFPGIKIALPSTALDAYGLLKSAIRCHDPVLFLEHKGLYRQNFAKSILPNNPDFVIPFGKGVVRRQGKDATIVTYGFLVQRALEAASHYADKGIEIEVIDLRTIQPYDFDIIAESVQKTSRLLVLHEDCRFMGFGAEIAAEASEKLFHLLDAPVIRIAGADTPVPYSEILEEQVLPQARNVSEGIERLLSY